MSLQSDRLLDDIGWRILEELQRNARLSFSELAARVGLSPPATAERVRRMEDAGIITGYRAEVDPAKLGLPMMVIIRVVVPGEREARFSALTRELPEVLDCYRTTGTDSFIMRAVVASVAHLGRLLDRLDEWGQPTTAVVLSMTVAGRGIARSTGDGSGPGPVASF